MIIPTLVNNILRRHFSAAAAAVAAAEAASASAAATATATAAVQPASSDDYGRD